MTFPIDLLKRAEKGSPLSAEEYDTTLTTLETSINALKPVTNINVTVGAAGDYATVNAALGALTQGYPIYKKPAVRATITMLSGFELAEQLIFDGIDCSWITLTAEDAEVTVIASAITTVINGDASVISAINGGKSCFLNFTGNMDSSAANKVGLHVSTGGSISGYSMGIKNCGYTGAMCHGSGTISCYSTMNNSGAGTNGAFCNGGGSISCYATMNNSGAGTYGALCYGGGSISCYATMNNSGAGTNGAFCNGGGTISCSITMNNSGAGTYGALCYGGGSISCYSTMDNSGAGTSGALCNGGGTISCYSTMNNRKGVADDSTDTVVENGGYITRGGGNGGTSQTPGTMTASGYINK